MVNILILNFSNDYALTIKTIRNEVFTIEQQIDANEDLDGIGKRRRVDNL